MSAFGNAVSLAVVTVLAPVPALVADAQAAGCQVASLSSGFGGVCALRQDGKVSCWSDYETDYTSSPLRQREQGEFRHVATGFDRSCGIRLDGTVACWRGFDFDDEFRLPAPPGTFRQLSILTESSCGLREDGTLVCWDHEAPDVLYAPTGGGGTFEEFHGVCGRRSDGTVGCTGDWTAPEGKFTSLSPTGTFPPCGIRESGEIFCWDIDGEEYPFDVPPEGTFVQVSSTEGGGGCAIDTDEHLVCWGTTRGNPAIEGTFRQVSAGSAFPCAIRTNGDVACWPDYPAPYVQSWQPIRGRFSQVSTGGDALRRPTTCALAADGVASCWGNDFWGGIDVPGGTWLQLSMGPYNGCGLREDRTVECWGDDQLDAQLAPDGTFRQVSVGDGHACGLRDDGTVACWGYHGKELYAPEGEFVQVAEGLYHGCALRADGTVACWSYRQLPEIEEIPTPAGTFVQISASGRQYDGYRGLSCGVRADGRVECWGDVDAGMLDTPDGVFVQVAAGAYQACALRADGEVVCWGDDRADGLLITPPPGPFVQIDSGYYETCGVRTDGSVECWGYDQTLSICDADDLCGNGNVDEPEACDDGDATFAFGQACTAQCGATPCGRPVSSGATAPSVTDALFVLRTAVGTADCAPSVCNVDGDTEIDVTDALVALRAAVGLEADLSCDAATAS